MSTEEAVRLYSIPRVAEHLDTSKDTVYRLIREGALRSVDIGRGRSKQRVRADDLQAFIESRSREVA